MKWVRRGENARALGLGGVLLAGFLFFGSVVNAHEPLGEWLFFHYALAWVLALVLLGSSFVGGYGLLEYLGGARFSKREELTVATAVGVLTFGLLVFFIGLVGGLWAGSFYAIPAILVAVGWSRAARDLPRFVRLLRRVELRVAAWQLCAWALAAVALWLIYVQLLTPEAFGFDERWYHLPIAQRYALTGSTGRFEEGFWQQANPQLASYLYTWAFLTPRVLLFDRLEACAHIEFVLFLATLAQVPVLARRLAPRLRHPVSALVLLTFPCIYLYDGNLHVGADHVAAFFAIPAALAALRCLRELSPRSAVVFAACAGGLALTKFTAWCVVVPLLVLVGGRGVWLSIRRRPGAFVGLATAVGACLLVTAPVWLRNLVWFRDPLYPFLHEHFPSRPWNPDAPGPIAAMQTLMQGQSLASNDFLEALKATLTFSFIPNDWFVFHRDVPIFGSLFTLTLPCLLFVKRPARLVAAHACVMLSLLLWHLLHHADRYLQVLLPWMAAVTAACLARVWEYGWLARGPLLGLVALQLVWGGDVPFLRTHNLLDDSPVRVAEAFLASGFEQKPRRLVPYEPLGTIGEATPEDAVILAHDLVTILGLDRRWVTDVHESRFSYGVLRTPERIHRELSALHVTHLLWTNTALGRDSLASDFAFLDYALHYAEDPEVISGYTLARVPKDPPPATHDDARVVVLSCGPPYPTGVYRLSDLRLPVVNAGPAPPAEPLPDGPHAALATASFAAVERRCHPKVNVPPRFRLSQMRGRVELYVAGVANQ
ncbi:MAG TPA: hypothetical protein VFV94_00900 [Polyangiaceae bacterium]|nr:hypothetical protein [Polyangiaceae bacterium]